MYADSYPDTTAVADAESEADTEARMMRRQRQAWFPDAVKALKASAGTDAEMAANVRAFLPLYWSDPSRIDKHREYFEATSMSVQAAAGQSASRRYPFDVRAQASAGDGAGADRRRRRRLHLLAGGRQATAFEPAELPKLLLIEGAGHFPWPRATRGLQFSGVPSFLASLAKR